MTGNEPDTNTAGNTHWTTGGGEGRVDVWVWRAGRTDPLGLAEDQSWTAGTPREDSKAVNTYERNLLPTLGAPKYEHKDGTAYKGDFLFSEDADTIGILSPWYVDGDSLGGIPGLRAGTELESRTTRRDLEVRCQGQVGIWCGRWMVVLWRKLETPYPEEDALFEVGSEYEMSLAIMDRTNRRHSGSRPFGLKF